MPHSLPLRDGAPSDPVTREELAATLAAAFEQERTHIKGDVAQLLLRWLGGSGIFLVIGAVIGYMRVESRLGAVETRTQQIDTDGSRPVQRIDRRLDSLVIVLQRVPQQVAAEVVDELERRRRDRGQP